MKKKIYSILLAVGCLFGFSACDSLDLAPESSISDANYWKTSDHFSAFNTGISSYFRYYSWYYFLYGEPRSNFYDDTPYGGEAQQGYENIYLNSLSVDNPVVGNYGGLYNVINQINLMIAKTESTNVLSATDKSYYLGECYGLRAYLYFHLLRSYGGVIVYTDYTSGSTLDLSNLNRKQDSEETVMAQIKKDIEASEAAFNGNYAFTKGKNYWSLGATKMLKGEVYLWSGKRMNGGNADYQTAKTALQEVANCPGVGLLDDYKSVFAFSNKKNSEIIFSIYNGENETAMLGGSFASNMMPQSNYNNDGGHFTEDGSCIRDIDDSQISGLIRLPLAQRLYSKLYLDSDPRKRINLRSVYTKDGSGNLQYIGAYPYKFQGTMIAGQSSRSFYDDYPVYRYADCILLIAEAKALLGEDVASEINAIRKRAYGEEYFNAHPEVQYPNDKGAFYDGNDIVGGDDDVVEAVLKERARELIFEGRHWYDLRLMDDGTPNSVVLKHSRASRTRLLWPIDQSTLTNNNLLDQTPGYNTNN